MPAESASPVVSPSTFPPWLDGYSQTAGLLRKLHHERDARTAFNEKGCWACAMPVNVEDEEDQFVVQLTFSRTYDALEDRIDTRRVLEPAQASEQLFGARWEKSNQSAVVESTGKVKW
ncbi:hypothetical protein A1Q2_01245 [Trichosporon asahii var. asahii CBS 8904]|uniref:Uncharacterized protein n=1 Tax=Trichosporon asahii var. asahii (strain CBS 8904) TaxID=1220162 RepID=K1WU81_TRIAC|nr:hypothetical protein A1Q2_01245 [Trichosporon asahii var. asahii CBS 8904]